MSGRSSPDMLQAGASAPAFELKDVASAVVSSQTLLERGPALLFFFKISCPVCQFAARFIERLAATTNYQVIGISQDDAASTREFNRLKGVSFPVLLDESRQRFPVSNAFGIYSVPSLFLIEPDGAITTAFTGFSKQDFEKLGARAGVAPFQPDEKVPAFRAG